MAAAMMSDAAVTNGSRVRQDTALGTSLGGRLSSGEGAHSGTPAGPEAGSDVGSEAGSEAGPDSGGELWLGAEESASVSRLLPGSRVAARRIDDETFGRDEALACLMPRSVAAAVMLPRESVRVAPERKGGAATERRSAAPCSPGRP
jgi:hypothetical protein